MSFEDDQEPLEPREPPSPVEKPRRKKRSAQSDATNDASVSESQAKSEPSRPKRVPKPDKAEKPARPDRPEKPRPVKAADAPPAKQAPSKPAKPKSTGSNAGSNVTVAQPAGRIARAVRTARLIVRFGPIVLFLLIALIVFGPNLLRALRGTPPIPPVAPLFTPPVQYWAPKIAGWSEQYGVNANLIATLMQIESCGFPGATSQVGAQGLFQVMPMNFEESEQDRMTDVEINAKRGVGVIRDCLKWAENDVGLAMACYNGGPRLIYVAPQFWPQESRNYYTWGGGIFNDALRNASQSDTLDNWLDSGGQYLCEKAAETLGLATNQPRPTRIEPPTAAATPTLILPTLAIPSLAAPVGTAGPPLNNPSGELPTFALEIPTQVSR